MENVIRCTRELEAAICGSRAYQDFEKARKRVNEDTKLRRQLDEFRKRSYELHNRACGQSWQEDVDALEKEEEEFRKNPLVNDFLSSELEICRMIQRINRRIMGAIHLEIEEFADSIE